MMTRDELQTYLEKLRALVANPNGRELCEIVHMVGCAVDEIEIAADEARDPVTLDSPIAALGLSDDLLGILDLKLKITWVYELVAFPRAKLLLDTRIGTIRTKQIERALQSAGIAWGDDAAA